MAHPQEIREKLRRLYVSGEQTLETAALMAFVQEKHPKHLPAFVEVLEPFGAEVEKKFG